ncbi:MAG: ABC transporter substrate-binding protein [Rhodobacteraceae bacterium]|nr:ABC transporter substrate-binding protein [Paracoccaceae bacterium]MCY4138533.1 ABC transporter substrate-binding protein [Paracoccaceae bacterium]
MMTRHSKSLAAAIALAALPASVQAETLVVSWWGFNGDKLNEYIVEPFQEQCGCEIIFETGNSADRISKIEIRGGKGVDLIYLPDSFAQLGIDKGLFQTVDRSKLPNLDGVYEMAEAPMGDYGPAYTLGRVGIVYDSAQVSDPITSWADLWREDLAGKISLPGITTTAGPMVVVLAGDKAGVNAYEDPDAAFAEIEKLKPNVLKNYNTGSEMINLFSTGEISVSLAQDFALGRLQEAVPTVVWAELEDGDIATMNTINIPTGAVNVERAHEFINFVLEPELQKTLGENGVDAPVHPSVMLTPAAAKLWTYGAEMVNGLKRMDNAKMNAAKPEWIERWNEVFGN